MKHLDFTPTPVKSLPYYSEKFGCQLLCKRDDLFAEAGGGSKARMLQYILADVNRQNCDVLVTAGGPCSNFNRACAWMCAKIGVSMHLVVLIIQMNLNPPSTIFSANLLALQEPVARNTTSLIPLNECWTRIFGKR